MQSISKFARQQGDKGPPRNFCLTCRSTSRVFQDLAALPPWCLNLPRSRPGFSLSALQPLHWPVLEGTSNDPLLSVPGLGWKARARLKLATGSPESPERGIETSSPYPRQFPRFLGFSSSASSRPRCEPGTLRASTQPNTFTPSSFEVVEYIASTEYFASTASATLSTSKYYY